jgi:hypothetical protein
MGLKDTQKKNSKPQEMKTQASTPTKKNDLPDNIYYHVIRTHQTGAIVRDGITKVVQYEYICRNQSEPVTMINKINKNGEAVEVYAHCPACDIKILEGFYED